jgi:hypothetical protein
VLDHLPSSVRSRSVEAPGRSGSRLRSATVEATGILLATALALGVLAHLVLTARSTVFFDSGDSVLMPLIERSLHEGEAWRWAMSSVLFFVPEIPVYLAIAAVVPGVHAALVVNAVVTFVALYVLLRVLAGVAGRHLSRAGRVAAALAPVAVLTLCSLMEHSAQRATLELVSLFLTTTYYYGTTLAMVAALPLTVVAVGGTTSRRRRGALVGLVAVSAAATFSNPLFVMWAAVPVAVGALILLRRRALPRATARILVAATRGGAGLGYLARIPFAKYISIEIEHYFRAQLMLRSIGYYIGDFFSTAESWQGAIEMSLLTVAVTGTLAVAVVALARRWPTRIALPLVVAACSIVVTVIAAVVLGTSASRYLMPLFFEPAAASVVVLAHAIERAPQRTGLRFARPGRTPRGRRILVAGSTVVVVVAIALGAVAVRITATAPSTQTYAAATCLSDWIAGRDLTGAGRFWTMRALKTYGDSSVKIVQISRSYDASLWLDDAADYTGQEVSYLVVDSRSHFSRTPESVLGDPAETIGCGRYTILSYVGTTGASVLTTRIADSARTKIAERHL